jgi:signal transduction histidine kinase
MPPETNTYFINAIVVVSAIFTLVASFVIAYILYFKKRKATLIAEKAKLAEAFQQQLLQAQLEVQETTYSTLAKELHDNIGQLLSTAKMLLGLTERNLETPPDTLLTANATIGEAIQGIRGLSKSIDRDWLEQFNFIDNLQAEAARINVGKRVSVRIVHSGTLFLTANAQIILFRMVQEVMQNAIKHGNPVAIVITVLGTDHQLDIKISDDGTGFDTETIQEGMGLTNLKYRARVIGGSIKWESAPGQGTEVSINVTRSNE